MKTVGADMTMDSWEAFRHALATKVRVCSLRQLAAHIYHDGANPERAARQVIRRDVARGYLESHVGMARPELELKEPLLCGPIQSPSIDVVSGRIAYEARSRWKAPAIATIYVKATSRCRMEQGAQSTCVRLTRRNELTHDLHVTQMFLRLCGGNNQIADRWVLEDDMPHRTGRLRPDAMVIDADGAPTMLDFVGSYASPKLGAMIRGYLASRVRFEFW